MKSLFTYLFVSLIMLFSFTGCSLKEVTNSIHKSTVNDVAKLIKDRTPLKDTQGTIVTYSPAKPKQATHEDQEYTVEVTVTKGGQTSTTTFVEKVPHNPILKQKFIENTNKNIAKDIACKITTRGITHNAVEITYSPSKPKVATSKDQIYDVIVSVTKNGQTSTHRFVETVLCDPRLRDAEDLKHINYLASKIESRNNEENDGVSFTYNPAHPKEATHETQTYDVQVTITKGTQSVTTTFRETISFNKELRLKHKIQNMHQELKSAIQAQKVSLEEREEYKKYIQNMIVVVLEERILNVQARKELISSLMSMRDLLVEQREEEIKQILKANQKVIETLNEELKQRDIALDRREDLNLQIAKLIEQILADRSKSVEQRNQDIQKLLQLRDALIEQRKLMMTQSNK